MLAITLVQGVQPLHVLPADFMERAFGRELLAALEIAPPAALPVVGARGRVRRSRAWPVFANSRGEVTAYDEHGNLQWQVSSRQAIACERGFRKG